MVDEVGEPGADDGADGGPLEQGEDVLVGDALGPRRRQHEPGAEQEADRDPDAVRRDRNRPDVHVDDRVIGDGGQRERHAPFWPCRQPASHAYLHPHR